MTDKTAGRLASLRRKHAAVAADIEAEERQIVRDSLKIHGLKVQKCTLRYEIAKLAGELNVTDTDFNFTADVETFDPTLTEDAALAAIVGSPSADPVRAAA